MEKRNNQCINNLEKFPYTRSRARPQSTLMAPYILLTNAYAVKKPMVPVSKAYTVQASPEYAKNSSDDTKP